MQSQIYPQQWIHQPKAVRVHLAKVFNIPHSGVTEIRDQEVVSDGYTMGDLKSISLEKMNEYIGSVETFGRAWEITLSKVNFELNPAPTEVKRHVSEPDEKKKEVDDIFTKPIHHNAKETKGK